MNREIWDLLVGFPFDKRENFGMMLLWDGARSTKATLVVKVNVEELKDVPSSIVVGESDGFNSESWTLPIVILQKEILGGGPTDEDPNPVD